MIDILMATYNGEKYLKEQINSIINQTYKKWKLYIRDDGSKDKTTDIIIEYVKLYPDKIIFIQDDNKGLGAKLNFEQLLKQSNSNYCMFCDQDDVWIDNKIENSFNEMKRLEEKHGKDKPILVHTDLIVVDQKLDIIDNSFFNFMSINPMENNIKDLLMDNTITGCTMMLNKPLIKKIKYIPEESFMHDWWIGLVASCTGIIYTIKQPTIMYRQHNNNTVGAKNKKDINIKRFINNKNLHKKEIRNMIKQAEVLISLFNNEITNKDKYLLEEIINLRNKSYLGRRLSLIKNKIFYNKIRQNIILFMYI